VARRDDLEKMEMQMGRSRGRLAVALDALTDALVLAGQHSVYCHAAASSEATRDMKAVVQQIEQAKELISSVMEELRRERETEV
jgi:hypothetical protein